MEDEHGSQRQQKQKLEKGGSGGVSSSRKVLLGKYEMGRLLGQGTFAKVYYGKHLKSGESVAIKVIKMEQVKKEGLMEQIKREISIMRLVRHPNVVELKEVMATKSKIYFIMEYVRGGELFAKVYKGKLKEDEARKYFQQLIRAVDFCHSRGVCHRDLKPENLLLDDKGDLKISDFGLSALRRLEHGELELLHTQCGTPAYVAPEVMRKKGYDGGKADIWSCGVILFVLLAGFLPFQDENIMRMYCKVFRADFEFPPWFSADTKSLISKLLVADPAKRITISSIMQFSWFNNNNNKNKDDQPKEETLASAALQSESELQSQQSPPFFNAFQLISSMSSGFDLSNLFEKKKKTGAMFTSKCCVSTIMEKLESMAKLLRFKVGTVNGKELFKVNMQRREAGRKGKLAVEAQIFEVAPQVTVVEFSKSSGDTLEYVEFCAQEVRPALKDIVWTWQG